MLEKKGGTARWHSRFLKCYKLHSQFISEGWKRKAAQPLSYANQFKLPTKEAWNKP